MKELTAGMFARSLAGHDKGKLYIVTAADGEFVYLADGRLRLTTNPKRKKRKHVQPDFTIADIILERQSNRLPIREEDIRKAIKTKEVCKECQRQM